MPAKTPQEVDALFEKQVNEGNLEALVDLYEPTQRSAYRRAR
jgi:hypothetical protein